MISFFLRDTVYGNWMIVILSLCKRLQGHMLEVCQLTGESHLSHGVVVESRILSCTVFLSAQTFTASQLHTDSAAVSS
ncbi:hypothetical protein NQZ68_038992 [Dissostichus eleginoides]|nr:hypothetical protein NQZ68_038992 [Dissostichus eleginoides]